MKRYLMLMRHAKSDWKSDFSRDSERPLNKRGYRDARKVGKWWVQHFPKPDLVYCSSSTRTQETLDILNTHLNVDARQIEILDSLYLASANTMMQMIKHVPIECSCLLLIAHNPGIEELVCNLSNSILPVTKNGKLFTTANLAIFEVEDLAKIRTNQLNLVQLFRPADEIT